jgi:hypothetical protein
MLGMDCPRCGETLTEYAFEGREAYGCEACGWLGVDVEHGAEPEKVESWAAALRRFRD